MSQARVGADILDWAAGKYPYAFLNWCEFFATANGLTSIPHDNDPLVKRFRRNMSNVRDQLRRQYKRAVITKKDIGVRGSVDVADILKNFIYRPIGRWSTTLESVLAWDELVDLSKVPDTEENQPYVEWYGGKVRPALATVSHTMGVQLLPPRKPELLPARTVDPRPPRPVDVRPPRVVRVRSR